jgi:adenosine deaminase
MADKKESAVGQGKFTRDDMQHMPKVDLHRHLEGSLSPEFFLELAKEFPITLPSSDVEELRTAITMIGQPPSFIDFLKKFETLRTFYVSQECIQRAAREAIRTAADDNVRYLELRYNPIHFATQMGFRHEQVIEWITEARNEAAGGFGLQVELIATVNRNDPVQESLPVIEAAVAGAGQHFVGIDIAGDENAGSLTRFAGVLRKARASSLGITIHAGEVGPAANIRDAIRLLGAHRIGHGIRVLDDPEVVELAKEAGTVFEVCPTSNFCSGAAESIEKHPIADMARAGLAVGLFADDPVMCGTTLTDEYLLVANGLGLEKTDFLELNLTALQGAFRPREERNNLAEMFEEEFTS